MDDPTPPKWQDLPESALLLIVASSFIGAGTASLMSGDALSHAVVAYLIGTAFFALGVSWHWAKRMLGTQFSKTLTLVATDFRYWLAILGVAFLYLGYPAYRTGVSSAPKYLPSLPASSAVPPTMSSEQESIELSPEHLSSLTNEDLRAVAYDLSEKITGYRGMQIHKISAIDSSSYSDAEKSQQRLQLDAEINRGFRIIYVKASYNLIVELKKRDTNEDHKYLYPNMMHILGVSGMISLGDVDSIANELVVMAQSIP